MQKLLRDLNQDSKRMGSAQLSRSPVCFFPALCCLPPGEQKDAAVDKRNEDGKDRYEHARSPKGGGIVLDSCGPMSPYGKRWTWLYNGRGEGEGNGTIPEKKRQKRNTMRSAECNFLSPSFSCLNACCCIRRVANKQKGILLPQSERSLGQLNP